MSYNLSELQAIYPNQLWLELSPQAKHDAWEQTSLQLYSTPAARWRAFINFLCLNTFANWLKDDSELSRILKIPSLENLTTVWEVVNGCIIDTGNTKLVLIPTDKSNPLELEVPAEWVNIPGWAGQYYLAVHLNLEQSWLRVWGYATHQMFDQATFNQFTRAYCLDREFLVEDLNIMWVTREYSQPQLNIKPLLTTSQARSKELLHTLSHSNIHSPRLHGNFDEWSAYVASDIWRNELYQQRTNRLGTVEAKPHFTNLSLWLDDIFETAWQQVDTLLNSQQRALAAQFRNDTALTPYRTCGAKLIDLGMQLGNKAVVLLVGLSPEIDDKVNIRVQLYPTSSESYLPASVKLSLMLPSGAVVQEVMSRSHDNYIQLKRFKFPLGKSFSIQLMLNDIVVKESFRLDALIGKSP
jgi:Protein of unknown function (DUF1822)